MQHLKSLRISNIALFTFELVILYFQFFYFVIKILNFLFYLCLLSLIEFDLTWNYFFYLFQ